MNSPFFAFVLLAGATLALAADDSKPVKLAETPPAVQKTIAGQVADGKLGFIEQTTEDGDTTFDVGYVSRAGDQHDFSVADDGTLLSIAVELTETPEAVQKTIKAQAAGWALAGIDKSLDDEEIFFDVEVTKAGRYKAFTVTEDGDLASMEVALADAPPAVQAAINARVADGSLKSVDETIDPEGNVFDVEAAAKDGSARSFTVAADGSVLSEQVTLEQVPPPARKTIQEQLAGGKILRIDKALKEKKKKVLPYEVEGRKDGKRFDFSVGPQGRFLGMDD